MFFPPGQSPPKPAHLLCFPPVWLPSFYDRSSPWLVFAAGFFLIPNCQRLGDVWPLFLWAHFQNEGLWIEGVFCCFFLFDFFDWALTSAIQTPPLRDLPDKSDFFSFHFSSGRLFNVFFLITVARRDRFFLLRPGALFFLRGRSF